jgi:EPS-associated MarR family transcriptional regulator
MTTSQRPEHNETIRYRALRLLEHQPHLTQRELAQELGISVGKVNFLLKALAEKGLVKFSNFQQGDAKLKKLAYLLTPEGLQHRLALTHAYLERKTRQYEALHAELASLRAELGVTGPLPSPRAGE